MYRCLINGQFRVTELRYLIRCLNGTNLRSIVVTIAYFRPIYLQAE
jgi:hypothetical protein